MNILVLGSDWRAESGYHTATIILATFKSDGSVSLTSFPRDLYVYIPGWHMDRIDAVLAHGGFALVTKTFDYNFGFHPDHYILTNIKGLQSIIDSLGGINVKVAKSFHDARSGYPGGYTVNPGTVHMDGETALWYIIGSKPGNEFDRLRRTQEVLVGIGEKLLSLNGYEHAPELYKEYHAAVDTDLQPNDVLNLVPRLLSIKPSQLSRYTIGTDQVIPWTDPLSHTSYLLPRPEEINKVLQQALGKP